MRFPRAKVSARPIPRATAALDVALGRVFAFFGATGSGVTTLLRTLDEESETKTRVLQPGPDTEAQIEEARRAGIEIIFLDGAPTSAAEVQHLYDSRWIAPGWGGGVFRLHRDAVVDPWFARHLGEIEERIRELSLVYHVIRTDDLENAAINIAQRVGLWR